MTRSKPAIAALSGSSGVRLFLVLGALCLAFLAGRLISQTLEMTLVVPILFLPLVVIGLRNPVLLVLAFPIVFYTTRSDWRFMGLSTLELVGYSMVGLAVLRVALRRDPFPHSHLYFPIFLYGLFISAYLLMFPEHVGTQYLWGSTLRGLALYLGAAVFIKDRRNAIRFVAAMAIACLVPLIKMLFALRTLPYFSPLLWGRGLELVGNYTTWALNQIAAVLLLCALAFPDTRIKRLSGLGFASVVILDVISGSRGGIVDLVLVLLLAAPYLFSRRSSAVGRVLIWWPLIFAWLYGAIANFDYIGDIWDSLIRDFSLGTSRVDAFLLGWEALLRFPATGGLMALGHSPSYGHSYWGAIAGDYGILFLLVNLVLMALIVRDAYLLSRRGDDPILSTIGKGMLIGTLVALWQMLHDSVLYVQSFAMIFWLLRGVTTACLNMPNETVEGRVQSADGR